MAACPRIVLGDHARSALAVRGLEPAWIERTLREPDEVEPDPDHPGRSRAYAGVPERDGRVMHVVYESGTEDGVPAWFVVTAFLDRGRTRKLRRSP